MADRVVAVVRHQEAVLCCGGSETNHSPSLPSTPVGDRDLQTAIRGLLDELGAEPATIERQAAGDHGTSVLINAVDRGVEPGDSCTEPTWEPPSKLFEQGEWADWRSYQAVAPTVETVADDTDRGSMAITVDALWVLRDAATEADGSSDLDQVRTTAHRLIEARPTMAALGNRVNRVMTAADTPDAIEAAATEGIVQAFAAVESAARTAAEVVADNRVLTLSRSGTVRRALLDARPALEILVSRPGGEGAAVADELGDAGLSVSTIPDARVYDRLRSGVIDAVLVGADAVTADGYIVNKVGTRATALAAELAGVPFYVVCTSDKIRPSNGPGPGELPLEPMFDLTPPELVTAVLTERGRMTVDEIFAIATDHQALSRWQQRDPRDAF